MTKGTTIYHGYAIATADDSSMVMAGLWETWKDPASGNEIQSCTILTWQRCTTGCR
jgi:putative SOS response-associated peptidase YedK